MPCHAPLSRTQQTRAVFRARFSSGTGGGWLRALHGAAQPVRQGIDLQREDTGGAWSFASLCSTVSINEVVEAVGSAVAGLHNVSRLVTEPWQHLAPQSERVESPSLPVLQELNALGMRHMSYNLREAPASASASSSCFPCKSPLFAEEYFEYGGQALVLTLQAALCCACFALDIAGPASATVQPTAGWIGHVLDRRRKAGAAVCIILRGLLLQAPAARRSVHTFRASGKAWVAVYEFISACVISGLRFAQEKAPGAPCCHCRAG